MEARAQPGDGAYQSFLSIQWNGDSQLLRARELGRYPRPLTDDERSVIDTAIAPVLHDLRAADAILPQIDYEARDRGTDDVCARIRSVDRTSGQRVWAVPASSAAERVVQLADQVQEWEVEELCAAGRSATWPECPEHPASHPLEPVVDDHGAAIWRCPRSGLAICAIGQLTVPRD
jgi:hypothetical protein